MEEFAAISGLSRPTVSKYFNDPDSVRSSTRERIEAAINKYDYRPNIFAINQNRKLTKNIGIVVPYLADPFFTEIARKIQKRCFEAGFWPMLFSSHGEQQLENDILDGLRGLRPAGVLLAPLGRASDRAEIEKFTRDVPTVLFDSNIDGLGEAFVGSDNFSFVSQTVEYLTRSGEPPSFFEMRTPANPNANKRREAYITMMERLGLEPNVIKIAGEGWAFEEIGRKGALKIFARARAADRYRSVQQRPPCHRLSVSLLRVGDSGRSQERMQPAGGLERRSSLFEIHMPVADDSGPRLRFRGQWKR